MRHEEEEEEEEEEEDEEKKCIFPSLESKKKELREADENPVKKTFWMMMMIESTKNVVDGNENGMLLELIATRLIAIGRLL